MKIGENIKKYRKQKKLTQPELGTLINKSESSIRKYESDDVIPSIEVLQSIAKALHISVSILTTNNIEQRIYDLMKEQNISIEDMIIKAGLIDDELPILKNATSSVLIPNKKTLLKISNALNITFNDLIKDTIIESWFSPDHEKSQLADNTTICTTKPIELCNMDISQRRKIDCVSIQTMATLLDLTELETEIFETESYKNPIVKSKCISILSKIETFQQTLLTTILNSNNVNLKDLLNLTDLECNTLTNLIVSNINNLIPEVQKLSNINSNSKPI